MKWLLDTNVISESVRPIPDRRVSAWIAAQPEDQFRISILTLAELQAGIVALGNVRRKRRFDAWMETYLLPNFADRTLPISIEILVDWLRLSRQLNAIGRPQAAADLLIAATARTYSLITVTRNVRHFANTGLVVYDPWTGRTHHMDAPDAR